MGENFVDDCRGGDIDNAHLFGFADLLVWIPLFFCLYKVEIESDSFKLETIFGVSIGLLMTTMAISLVPDLRDVTVILTTKIGPRQRQGSDWINRYSDPSARIVRLM